MSKRKQSPRQYIQTLEPRYRAYAQAHLDWINEKRDVAPWAPDFGLYPSGDSDVIRRRLGTLR